MLHSLPSGLYHARNEEFPALIKSQPISFGNPTARFVRHTSPGDVHGTPQNSRKKRVRRKKQASSEGRYLGDFCIRENLSKDSTLDIGDSNSTNLARRDLCSQKPAQSKEALLLDQPSLTVMDSLTTFRATEDEGFVDGIVDSLVLPGSKAPLVIVEPFDSDSSLVVHKQHTICDVDAPVSVSASDPGSSSSSCSVSRTSSSSTPGVSVEDADETVCCSKDGLAERSMCAQCEEKCGDVHVFGSLELPHPWDTGLSHTGCCRLTDGDAGNRATAEHNCSAITATSAPTATVAPRTVIRAETDAPSATGNNSTGALDDLDEDEMEGADLLHLISNSLDRFNAIVHPHDLSGLTSGLGASESLLSELDWSFTDGSNSLKQFKPTGRGASVEEFTETHLSWFNSHLTASSCPDKCSLEAQTNCGALTQDRNDLDSPPPPRPQTFLSSIGSCNHHTPRDSPCTNVSYVGDRSLGPAYPRPTSLNLAPLGTIVQSQNELIPGLMGGSQSLATSPFDSEPVYQGPQSVLNTSSHQQPTSLRVSNSVTSHGDTKQLDPTRLISASHTHVSTQSALGFPFASSSTSTVPWPTTSDSGSSTNSRSFLSGSGMDWDSLSRGLDWFSIQAGNRYGGSASERSGLVADPIADTERVLRSRVPGLPQSSSAAAPPPGLTPCPGTAMGFEPVPGLDTLPVFDLQMLLTHSPFTRTAGQALQASTVVATDSSCDQSLLSTCFASGPTTSTAAAGIGLPWDVKNFDGCTFPYSTVDRPTGPPATTTLSHTIGRSRLPHSDSVTVVGAEFEVGGRRASVSSSPFDLTNVGSTHPQSALRFDSPDRLIVQPPFVPASLGIRSSELEPSVRSTAGNAAASNRRIIGSSACSAFLIQHPEANHVTRAGSMRFANTTAMTATQPQIRQTSWSTGWQTKSPTLRTIGGENYRHGAPNKRFNHGPAHLPAVTDRCTDMPLFGNTSQHTPVGLRGGSPSTSVKANAHLTPFSSSPTSSSSSSSSSCSLSSSGASSSCGRNTTTSTSSTATALVNGLESSESGKPVIAKWRRACSFYLRGHCKKEDCEFAHDLTKVTCKFWEMGECFKGPTCPFLHGYPPELTRV